jgi:hypothetical protein
MSQDQCPAGIYRLKQFLLLSLLFRQGASGEGIGSLARTAPPNVRAAKERRERGSFLPSAFLWIIVSFPLCIENMKSQQRCRRENLEVL